jgi:4-diphosphocytidyl-2-C-methyl-D-erythritol kinase
LIIVTGVTARVPAKLNLQLAVGPPRADGYHDLVTVFHAVSLFDEVTVEPAARDAVTVTGEGAGHVPRDGDNLALRAVRALRTRARGGDRAAGVRVTIAKRIPVAAGLAGGSADAAAALTACNELWAAGLTPQQLAEVAATIGSDVAFALLGGTAVGRGRGERLTPALAPATRYHWVLAFADGQLSTPDVYAALDRLRASGGDGGMGPPEGGPRGPRGPGGKGFPPGSGGSRGVAAPGLALDTALMSALRSGDAALLGRALSNDLQPAALSLFPSLRKTLAAGLELGALGALVSGSGPTCVFLAASAERATELAVSLSAAGVCRSVARVTGPVPGAAVVPA